MALYVALYNPNSNCGEGEKSAHRLDSLTLSGDIQYIDITTIADYSEFFFTLLESTSLIICGGDGTLNRFVNETKDIAFKNQVYYFACGTGNDFLRDIDHEQGEKPIDITSYLKNLPVARVNGCEYHFLNNVGFGIDGYCTQVGDEMRAAGKRNINYAGIAIKGLLGGFHPVDAVVTVDGKTKNYRNAWLAPTMKGRFYGGGMMPTPQQDRNSDEREVSVMVYHTKSKLKALTVFPSIFQGKHVKHPKMVDIIKGHDIKVVFSRPCPLQIDGETILGVTEYEVHTDNKGKHLGESNGKQGCAKQQSISKC